MTAFMDKDFLLTTDVARKLYHEVAAELPVIDYHSHLQQGEIAERKKFRNIAELWLGGDHYKWRLMRTAGVPEEYCTGARSDKEKFLAFCKVLPLAVGNPIYHWSHLELRRIFGIELVINEANAEAIWEQANAKLATMDTWTFLEQAKVEIACTTDDPADDLLQHAEIAQDRAQDPRAAGLPSGQGHAHQQPGLRRLRPAPGASLGREDRLLRLADGSAGESGRLLPCSAAAASPTTRSTSRCRPWPRRRSNWTRCSPSAWPASCCPTCEQAQYLRGLLE